MTYLLKRRITRRQENIPEKTEPVYMEAYCPTKIPIVVDFPINFNDRDKWIEDFKLLNNKFANDDLILVPTNLSGTKFTHLLFNHEKTKVNNTYIIPEVNSRPLGVMITIDESLGLKTEEWLEQLKDLPWFMLYQSDTTVSTLHYDYM